jgi:hypothetical protein
MEVEMKRRLGFLVAPMVMAGVALGGCDGLVVSPPAPTNPGNVAVLVVDDFGLGKSKAAAVGGASDNCAIGTNEVGSGGAGDDLPPSQYSHGELVYQVLKDELTGLLSASSAATATSPAVVPSPTTLAVQPVAGRKVEVSTDWTYAVGGQTTTVRLVAVHADAYRTADIIAGISSVVRSLHTGGDGGPRFDRFVLNLSFAVVPCDVQAWLDGAAPQALLDSYEYMVNQDPAIGTALEDYLGGGVLSLQNVASPSVTAAVLTDDRLAKLRPFLVGAYYDLIAQLGLNDRNKPLAPLVNDDAWEQFRTDNADLGIITVAAAGNGVKAIVDGQLVRRQLLFPFAPGLWDSVVSASVDAPEAIASRFNSGEVKLLAKGPALVQGSFGSSFAAPRLSAREALYLLRTGQTQCRTNKPPLNYVDAAVSATPVWANLGASDWHLHCPEI